MDAAGTNGEIDFDLTCWYLNFRRTFELLNSYGLGNALRPWSLESSNGQWQRLQLAATVKDLLLDWFQYAQPPTLGQLLLKQSVKPGAVFTHLADFYGRGLSQLRRRSSIGAMAQVYAKLDHLSSGGVLRVPFDPEHLLSHSAWTHLGGHNRLLVLGFVNKVEADVIEAIPYVLASVVDRIAEPSSVPARWQWYGEVSPASIDNFRRVQEELTVRLKQADLLLLKPVPEAAIKQAFAEIIGEPDVPKDWGGERSDLLTGHVRIDGRQISTAFLFKGPAHFRPLHMAGVGKNGDQIDRLFTEPADLLILQHCHRVERDVMGAMRAYSNQMGDRDCSPSSTGTPRFRSCGPTASAGSLRRLKMIDVVCAHPLSLMSQMTVMFCTARASMRPTGPGKILERVFGRGRASTAVVAEPQEQSVHSVGVGRCRSLTLGRLNSSNLH